MKKANKTVAPKVAAQCPEWTWEDRCAKPAGHVGAHECAAAAARRLALLQGGK